MNLAGHRDGKSSIETFKVACAVDFKCKSRLEAVGRPAEGPAGNFALVGIQGDRAVSALVAATDEISEKTVHLYGSVDGQTIGDQKGIVGANVFAAKGRQYWFSGATARYRADRSTGLGVSNVAAVIGATVAFNNGDATGLRVVFDAGRLTLVAGVGAGNRCAGGAAGNGLANGALALAGDIYGGVGIIGDGLNTLAAAGATIDTGRQYAGTAGLEAQGISGNAREAIELTAGATLELDLIGNIEEAVDGEITAGQLGESCLAGTRQAEIWSPCDNELAKIGVTE